MNIETEWADKLPFSNKNTCRRRELIYNSIDLDLSYDQVNSVLLSNNEKELSEQEKISTNLEVLKRAFSTNGLISLLTLNKFDSNFLSSVFLVFNELEF